MGLDVILLGGVFKGYCPMAFVIEAMNVKVRYAKRSWKEDRLIALLDPMRELQWYDAK